MSDRSATSQVKAAIAHSLARTDRNVAHLNRVLASSPNVDTTLLVVGYSAGLVSALLARLETAQVNAATQSVLARLLAVAPKALLSGETLVATISAAPDAPLVRAKESTKNLATLISGHRMFMRLMGLPKIWMLGSATFRNPPEDALLRYVNFTQVAALATFQYLENTAYLALNGVLHMAPERIGRRMVLAARCWCVYVMLQFVNLLRRRQLAGQKQQLEKQDADTQAALVKADAKWWRDLYSNAAWAPLTIHWSLAGGYMPDEGIALLSLTAGWLGLRQAWIAAA